MTEPFPPLDEVEREWRQMLREMSAEWQERKSWREAVEYLVDAGLIQRVTATKPADAVQLALLAIGPRAQFPVDVYSDCGDKTTFILAEAPKKSAASVGHERSRRRA